MLTAVLSILKIIGSIILILLGVLLCVICLVFFVPLRYRAEGEYNEAYRMQAKASWLLHIVSFLLLLEKDKPLQIKLRLFGIPVYDNLKEKKERRVRPKKEKRKKKKEEPQPEIVAASLPQEAEESKEPEPEKAQEAVDTPVNAAPEEKRSLYVKLINFFKKIKYTIQKICDTIRNVKDNLDYYTSLLQEESTLAAFASCKKQLVRVLRHLSPQKFQVKLHIGREDPAAMGDIMGVWGMLYPIHMGRIELYPDFEQQIMEGSFSVKGRITVFVFVRAMIILIFDKDIGRLRKRLTREPVSRKEKKQ